MATLYPNSADCLAYECEDTDRPPDTQAADTETQITGDDLTKISTDDEEYQTTSAGANKAASHRIIYNFGATEPSSVTVYAKGMGTADAGAGWYLYGWGGANWGDVLDSHTGGSKAELSADVTGLLFEDGGDWKVDIRISSKDSIFGGGSGSTLYFSKADYVAGDGAVTRSFVVD